MNKTCARSNWLPLHRGLFVLITLMVLTLSGCSGEDERFKGTSVTGLDIGQSWQLVDMNGILRQPQSFAGQVQLVFFGFTQCPDICPTTLSVVAEALTTLGDEAHDVQVLMITVDPERDTAASLQAYLQAFDTDLARPFLGLTGTQDELHQAAEAFRAYYAKVPIRNGEDYTMDHSASLYLMDHEGRARVMLSGQSGPAPLVHDLEVLLSEIR